MESRLDDLASRLLENVQQVLFNKEQAVDGLARHRAFVLMAARLAELGHRVERLTGAAESATRAMLRHAVAGLTALDQRLRQESPVAQFLRRKVRLQTLAARLDGPVLACLSRQGVRLGQAGAALNALSPLANLGRGYSICLKPDGSVVSRTGQVLAGDGVALRVSDGSIDCRVERTSRMDTGGN